MSKNKNFDDFEKILAEYNWKDLSENIANAIYKDKADISQSESINKTVYASMLAFKTNLKEYHQWLND